jgi:signal transduction histidine kinase
VRYRCELSETAEVPRSIARTAYRVIQEGLTNARKHAPGAPIDVVLTGDPECGLRVEIRNPMPSWPIVTTVPGSGLGLVGLSERVQLAGGRLDHERTADDRFVLTARLPWRR